MKTNFNDKTKVVTFGFFIFVVIITIFMVAIGFIIKNEIELAIKSNNNVFTFNLLALNDIIPLLIFFFVLGLFNIFCFYKTISLKIKKFNNKKAFIYGKIRSAKYCSSTLVMEFNGEKLYNINFTYLNEYQDIKECKSVETYSAAAVKAFETIQKFEIKEYKGSVVIITDPLKVLSSNNFNYNVTSLNTCAYCGSKLSQTETRCECCGEASMLPPPPS